MSAVSMANLAMARRVGISPTGSVTTSVAVLAQAAHGQVGQQPLPENVITGALKVVTSYIPTEVLTVYVAGASIIFKDKTTTLFFLIHLVATPFTVWAVFGSKLRTAGQPLPWNPRQWPLWEMFAATAAFGAWAASLKGSPLLTDSFTPEAAGFLVLVVTTALGLVASLVNTGQASGKDRAPVMVQDGDQEPAQ